MTTAGPLVLALRFYLSPEVGSIVFEFEPFQYQTPPLLLPASMFQAMGSVIGIPPL